MNSEEDLNDEKIRIDALKAVLLSKKDQQVEEYIKTFMSSFNKNDFESSMKSADLSLQERFQQAQRKMADSSIILAHKYTPFIKELVNAQEQQELNAKFAVIKATPAPLEDMAKKYRNCFNTWINSKDDVHLKVLNPKEQLGNIAITDMFTLIYFATITSRRQTGDNMLQLMVTGYTSCGKTMIFEAPLLDVSHVLTTEKGVSRFNCDSKSTMLLHDINVDVLVKGSDTDKMKAICRGEPVPTKTYGSVQTVPSVFVFVTSNRRLMSHVFDKPERKLGSTFQRVYKTDVKSTRSIHPGDVSAVQSRFLEAFVRQRPKLNEEDLPKHGTFERTHVIVGLFDDVICILTKYSPEDYPTQYYYLYAIGGLCKHVNLLPEHAQGAVKPILFTLMIKYNLDQHQMEHCCKDMDFVQVKNERDSE
jgi:hypothetical protein